MPLFHQCQQQRCLFIGGGKIAQRRAQYFADKGMIIDVVSPQITPELKCLVAQSQGVWQQKEFAQELISKAIEQYWCLVAASNCSTTNNEVMQLAKKHNIMVNVVDKPDACDFIFPAIIERDSLTFAIANSGNSPVLSKAIKQELQCFYPTSYGCLSEFIGTNRAKVKAVISDKGLLNKFWHRLLQSDIAVHILNDQEQQAKQLFTQALANVDAFVVQGSIALISSSDDIELLSLKAIRLLQQADTVFYDKEVNSKLVEQLNTSCNLQKFKQVENNCADRYQQASQLISNYAEQGNIAVWLTGNNVENFAQIKASIQPLLNSNIRLHTLANATLISS